MQLVDSFIPITPQRPRTPSGQQPRQDITAKHRPMPGVAKYSYKHPVRPVHQAPPTVPRKPERPPAPPLKRPAAGHAARKETPAAPPARTALQLMGIMGVAGVAGFMVQSVVVGEILIGVYALVAFVLRIKSRVSFLLALMSMVAVSVLLVIRSNNVLASTFSVYAFLFLIVGTISLALERPRSYRARV